MADDRKQSKQNANEQDEKHSREQERPDRARLRPNEPERPGGERAGKAAEDAANKAARRGER